MITLFIAQAVTLATPGPARSQGAYRVVETWPGTDYTGMTLDGLTATDIARVGIRLRGKVDRVTIRHFSLTHAATPNVPPDLPAGIAVENGTGIVVQDGVARDFRMVQPAPGGYWNGDGFSTERAVTQITFRRVSAYNASDGCFDLKSTATVLDKTTADGCGISYRLWGTGEATTITSAAPRKYHVGLYTGAVWHIGHLVVHATTTAPIFHTERLTDVASLIVDRCTLDVPAGTKLFEGRQPAHLVLGPGCAAP